MKKKLLGIQYPFRALIWATIPLLWIVASFAQNTASTPINFAIYDPDGRPTYETAGEIQWENVYGTSIKSIRFYPDSVRSALRDTSRMWRTVIDSIGTGADTQQVYVTVEGQARRGKPDPFTAYVDSLGAHVEREVNNVDFFPGIDILLPDTSNITVGDTVELVYTRRTFDPHFKSRLTIVAAYSDSIADDGDTTYSLAVPGNIENMTWRISSITSDTSDDSNQLGWGLQAKIDNDWGEIVVINDSVLLRQGIPFDTALVHPIADSLRTAQWGISTTTNLYVKIVQWLGGN